MKDYGNPDAWVASAVAARVDAAWEGASVRRARGLPEALFSTCIHDSTGMRRIAWLASCGSRPTKSAGRSSQRQGLTSMSKAPTPTAPSTRPIGLRCATGSTSLRDASSATTAAVRSGCVCHQSSRV